VLWKEGREIIDLFHTALNTTQRLFAPTLYCGDFNPPLSGHSRLVEKKLFSVSQDKHKTSSTLLNGIGANLHVNKTEKTRGKILYLDIFL
jgi:hypothetical protein